MVGIEFVERQPASAQCCARDEEWAALFDLSPKYTPSFLSSIEDCLAKNPRRSADILALRESLVRAGGTMDLRVSARYP